LRNLFTWERGVMRRSPSAGRPQRPLASGTSASSARHFAQRRRPRLWPPASAPLKGHGRDRAHRSGTHCQHSVRRRPHGAVVLESGSFRRDEEIMDAVRRITRESIRRALVTHPSSEVMFGAATFQARGIPAWMQARINFPDAPPQALQVLRTSAPSEDTRAKRCPTLDSRAGSDSQEA
jgi:hypothetical protein